LSQNSRFDVGVGVHHAGGEGYFGGMASPSPDPMADRTSFVLVVVVIGTLLVWATTANVLGGAIGFTTAVLVGAGTACCVWHDRISYDLVSNVALVGIPVLVVGLSLS